MNFAIKLPAELAHLALRAILRAVAVFCVRHGITLQEVVECLKGALVESAHETLLKQNQPISISRLSIMTGVHRTETARIHNQGVKPPDSQLRNLIGLWQQHKRFLDKLGEPKQLTFEGKDSEFADLVRLVSRDLSHYTVLAELERSGTLERVVKNDIPLARLTHAVYHPKGDVRRSFDILARDILLISHAVEENVVELPKIPHLHLTTQYDNIPKSLADELRSWIVDQGSEFHRKVRQHLAQFDRDLNPTLRPAEPASTVSIGTFSFIESDQERKNENE